MSSQNDYSELMDLDPEAFDWLDYAEEFFKHDGSFDYGVEGNVSRRNGTSYDLDDELEQLERMYEASPEKVIQPLMTLEKDGEITGFYMERVEGEHVLDYFREGKGDKQEHQEIIREVEDFIQKMQREGLVHGDLANNTLYDGDSIKVIDPVGTPDSREDFENLRELDEGATEVLGSRSKFLFSF